MVMSDKKWALALAVLFMAFIYLLVQFMMSNYKNQALVQRLIENETNPRSRPHVMLISQELDNPYWRTVEKGARDAADQLGIALEYVGPLRLNQDEQTKLLEKAIAAKVDAILLQGVRSIAYSRLINKAVEQGIPVITVDTDSPDSKRIAYVGSDNIASGARLGRLVKDTHTGPGKIGIILGSNLAENQMLRLEGFRSVISTQRDLQIVDIRASNLSRIEAAQKTAEMLFMHADINIIVGLSELDAGGILQAVRNSGLEGKIDIFGFDDSEGTKEALQRGEIRATIVQKPYQMGHEALSLLHLVLQGEHPAGNHYTSYEVLSAPPLLKEQQP